MFIKSVNNNVAFWIVFISSVLGTFKGSLTWATTTTVAMEVMLDKSQIVAGEFVNVTINGLNDQNKVDLFGEKDGSTIKAVITTIKGKIKGGDLIEKLPDEKKRFRLNQGEVVVTISYTSAWATGTDTLTIELEEHLPYLDRVNTIASVTKTITIVKCKGVIRIEPTHLNFDNTRQGLRVKKRDNNVIINAPLDRTLLLKRGNVTQNESNSIINIDDAIKGRLEKRHILIQFERLPTLQERTALADQGIRLLSYVPNLSYWASIDSKNAIEHGNVTDTVETAGGIKWA
ncbi:MAG: hypothetical protein DRR19_14175 [Candidatus Parabeggiatoa sp. nov. 1]|nr:MAG: hypothetical protein DRR19_14175 [Gammaproteobacteria bacterium]